MEGRKFGTWALSVGFCALSIACVDATDSTGGEGDGSATSIGEAGGEILFGGGRTSHDPWDNDPWDDGPGGYDPWDPPRDNDPWGNDPYDNDPWDGNPYDNDPWENDPWGTGHGGSKPLSHRQMTLSGGSLPSGISTIAWVSDFRGGIGGTDYEVACGAGMIATGFYGRSAGFVDQIGLVCAPFLPGGQLGIEALYGPTGGPGGDYFISKCPAGYGVAGFTGRADTVVNQLRLVCDVVPGTTLFYGPMFGGPGGNQWVDISPGGFFLTSISGRSGEVVDAVQGIYRFVKI